MRAMNEEALEARHHATGVGAGSLGITQNGGLRPIAAGRCSEHAKSKMEESESCIIQAVSSLRGGAFSKARS